LGPETQMPLALRIRPTSQAGGVFFTRATRRRADHRRGVSSGRRRCSDFRRRDGRNFRSRFWGRFSCRGALAAGVFDLSGGHACAYAASIDSGPTRSAPSTSARPRRANQLARRFPARPRPNFASPEGPEIPSMPAMVTERKFQMCDVSGRPQPLRRWCLFRSR
jgi:hypothetical protein